MCRALSCKGIMRDAKAEDGGETIHMSLRMETPPPLRPPTLLDAVNAGSYEHRRLFVEHVRVSEKLRGAQLQAMSDATLNPKSSVPISAASMPRVKRAC